MEEGQKELMRMRIITESPTGGTYRLNAVPLERNTPGQVLVDAELEITEAGPTYLRSYCVTWAAESAESDNPGAPVRLTPEEEDFLDQCLAEEKRSEEEAEADAQQHHDYEHYRRYA